MDEQQRQSATETLTHLLRPLSAQLTDPQVQEIMINGADSVWYERAGVLRPV
jgi:Flp pilus assembly CpaF family ATPase